MLARALALAAFSAAMAFAFSSGERTISGLAGAVSFLAAVFLAAGFLAAGFLAAAFLVVAFLAVAFLATDFLDEPVSLFLL